MKTDLALLDRLVGRAALALLEGDGELLETVYREAAKQSTLHDLAAVDHPLAPHVAHLTIARIADPTERDFSNAIREPSAPAQSLPRAVTSGPLVSVLGALMESVGASSLEASRAWLAVATDASTAASDAARTHREIAEEAARRLDVHADSAVASKASAFLTATSDLAHATAGSEPAAVFTLASARTAGEGWPRKASVRFVIEALGTDPKARRTIERLAERARTRQKLPALLGAASHMRVVRDFAFGLHARTPGDAPFAERHDPEWSGAHASALLIASALSIPHFHKRALGCGERTAQAQARALAVTGLIAARTDAARLLSPDVLRSERLFGRALDARLAAIVPRPRRDAHGRFRAWLAFPALLSSAITTHDEDWFRNPRFWEEMAIRFASPGAPSQEPKEGALAAMFERRLA